MIEHLKYLCIKKAGFYSNKGYVLSEKSARDIYLTEYPKSGITYLSQLIASYIEGANVNFFNLPQYVIDVHRDSDITPLKLGNTQIRLAKSHCEYHAEYQNVVYLAREPLNVLVSHFNYYNDFSKIRYGSFENFVKSRRGIIRLTGHLKSWISGDVNQRFLPCIYEDIVDSPDVFLRVFTKLYGLEYSVNQADVAIINSSKETMRQQEIDWNYGGRFNHDNMRPNFVGTKKFTKSEVDDKTLKFVQSSLATDLYKRLKNQSRELQEHCLKN